jgi:hypothetical protein
VSVRLQALISLALLTASNALAGSVPPAIADRWSPDSAEPTTFTKVAVVAIVADRDMRHRFENKLVSHLRGRGLMAVASYTLVEDLSAPGDPQRILDLIHEQSIDGAVTVRAFPVAKRDEEGWAEAWRDELAKDQPLREFVADSLHLSAKKSDRYGLDFAVWHGSPFHAIWAARTEVGPASRFRKQGGEVVQGVIDALEEAELFTDTRRDR